MTRFSASGASTGRNAKAQRICLSCLLPADLSRGVLSARPPTKNTCHCGGKIERFDSKAEVRNYHELKLREKAGEIHNIKVHPKFDLDVADRWGGLITKIGTYSPDFSYVRGVTTICREVKPHKLVKHRRGGLIGLKKPVLTADAALKIKLFKATWRIELEIVE